MKIRRDMIFAVLTTFCMCALMFTVIPIRSGLPYDPWADIQPDTPDGTIDIKDVSAVARLFGTSGESTKNVNVTNWPAPSFVNAQTSVTLNWYSDGGWAWNWDGAFFSTDGYAKMSFFIEPYDTSAIGDWGKSLMVGVNEFSWRPTPPPYSSAATYSYEYIYDFNVTVNHNPTFWINPSHAQVYDVKGPYCWLWLAPRWSGGGLPPPSYSTGWITLKINWYLRND